LQYFKRQDLGQTKRAAFVLPVPENVEQIVICFAAVCFFNHLQFSDRTSPGFEEFVAMKNNPFFSSLHAHGLHSSLALLLHIGDQLVQHELFALHTLLWQSESSHSVLLSGLKQFEPGGTH